MGIRFLPNNFRSVSTMAMILNVRDATVTRSSQIVSLYVTTSLLTSLVAEPIHMIIPLV